MNVTDFIIENKFNELLENLKNKEYTEYEKEFKVHGNKYSLYVSVFYNNNFDEWWLTSDFNYNYNDKQFGSRQVGGVTISLDCQNWKEFRDILIKRLKRFPDYTEEEQLSLF